METKEKMNDFFVSPGFVCIFHSVNKQPLSKWDKKIRSGVIRKVRDEDLCSQVLEISAPKIAATYITCPIDPCRSLGIKNPVLNLTVKNLNKYFAFDVQIQDDRGVKRRFRASTHQTVTEVKPFFSRLPLTLEDGWNQITFPLQEFTMRCFGTNHVETLRLQIYASCRLRRVFFSNKVCQEHDVPLDFRLNQLALPKRVNRVPPEKA
ncbi:hypothetical protein RUM43_004557 [Polyplax serrata]|uniref:CFA20 domain-containing protein n=1 Tax=Polyplax serrata TaxID=468196 RepID=A0AAN8SC82_POLSC